MTRLVVVRHPDAEAFLERARAWLVEREAEHNLILGIAASLMEGNHGYEPPVYLATVERGGEVAGCAWRTPPFKVGLTDMPAAAVSLLAADLAHFYRECDDVEGVLGPERVAESFSREWADLSGVEVRPGMHQRIYALTAVTTPPERAPGGMRRAAPEDREQVIEWWQAFEQEAGVTMGRDAGATVDRRTEAGVLWLWDVGRPVALAGAGSRTPNGVRVGPVYTPPEERRKGYATALVADLSQRLLDEGRSLCFLYTDLSNPTSNSIYTRVGYEPVADVRDFHFERVRP